MVTIYQALYNKVYINSLIHSSNQSYNIATIIQYFIYEGNENF